MLGDNGKAQIVANGGKPPGGEEPKFHTITDSELNKTQPPSKLSTYQQDFLSDDHKVSSDHKNTKGNKRGRGRDDANMFGSDPDEDDQLEILVKQMEMDVLRLTQRVITLEKSFPIEIIHMKEVLTSQTREQQLYIEQLHQDLDLIEKQRVKMYKEEEAERAKLLEDTIKLYEKTRELEDAQIEGQRRINIINEKVLRMR